MIMEILYSVVITCAGKQSKQYNMKNIIKRNLPLNVNYTVVDKKYIPLLEGFGCTCDNCGKLIANIATVANPDGVRFNIGFDCLETFLLNNNLLSQGDIEQYEKVKKMIPKVIRVSKEIKDIVDRNKDNSVKITGITFDKPTYESDYKSFYWESSNARRTNSYFKIKEMDLNFLITTLQNIFPNLTIKLEN